MSKSTSGLHDPYEDQLAAARYRAERDQARQELARLRGEATTMSAYDLLPADERDAIAWVRDHGGLESVKKLLDWVVGHCSTKQQLDFDFWLSGRVMYELGFEEDMADRDEVERRLLARLMPEGLEWLIESWPRFDDNEPLRWDDEYANGNGGVSQLRRVNLHADGVAVLGKSKTKVVLAPGERVKRPAILAADGEPLEAGQTVYNTDNGIEVTVDSIINEEGGAWTSNSRGNYFLEFDKLTHTKPEIDSWKRIEADAGCTAAKYNAKHGTDFSTKKQVARDIVRRCRALAEKESRNE